jgi:hypothetical protein
MPRILEGERNLAASSRSKFATTGQAMGITQAPREWGTTPRRRRNGVFALALAAHALLVLLMLRSPLRQDRAPEASVVEATIWVPRPASPAPPSIATGPSVARPPSRAVVARPAPASVDAPQAITLAPPGPASAASAPPAVPLNLTLSRDQIKALIAASKPTLAQSLARAPAPTALQSLAGDDETMTEQALPGGVTEVHVHGGCFRLVPTARAQYDPFNHANERVTAGCK